MLLSNHGVPEARRIPESTRWLLGCFEEYAKHGPSVFSLIPINIAQMKPERMTSNLSQRTTGLHTPLERFREWEMDIVIDAVDAFIDDANRDGALK